MENTKIWLQQALDKLKSESTGVKGLKEKAMASAVMAVIQDFCKQDEEFSQAVVQGGTFAACMSAVAQGVGSSISDLDAYKKAVRFYFPGAEVRMQMAIDLIGAARGSQEVPPAAEPMVLDLADFF